MSFTQTRVQYVQGEGQGPRALLLRLNSPTTPSPFEERLGQLIRDINAHSAFGLRERERVRQVVAESSPERAMIFIFLKIIGPAIVESGFDLTSLYGRAADLLKEADDAVEEEDDQEAEEEMRAAATEETVAYLEKKQEELASGIEGAMRERATLVDAAAQRVRGDVQEMQATAETVLPLADRIDAANARLDTQLGRMDQMARMLGRRR